MRRTIVVNAVVVSCVLAGVNGCRSPLADDDADRLLRRSVVQAIERELAAVPAEQWLQTTQPPGEVETALRERLEELDAIGPSDGRAPHTLDLGPDLTGRRQQDVSVSLQWAVVSAVRRNLDIQIARLQPAINEADVVAAEAVFDALFFSNVDLSKTDEPTTVPLLMGVELGTAVRASEQYRFETGLRKRLISGAEISLSADLTRFRNLAPGFMLTPDPAYTAAIRLGLTQPLLRGFGSEVNTATIRLTRNADRRSIEQLRSDMLDVVADTESAYWDLVFAWRDLAIQQWLVEVGIEVRDILERRREFDTRLAEYTDAVARVEQRKGNVIRARRRLRAASDLLKQKINDPQLTVGSEAILSPADDTIEAPISYSLRDAMLTAVSNRPEIQQAILAIDDASIREVVADNARLPLLNLSAQLAYLGISEEPGGSYDNVLEGDFIGYVLGLAFEWPIGNRAAEAGFRRARLERSAAVLGYRQAVQAVVLDVKSALRDVISDYQLIQATRSFRVAQAENLRALLVEEETMAGLTPEFLNLKFQRQETLASARQEEVLALVNYDSAVAALYRAMGTGLTMNRINLEIVDQADPLGPSDAPSR